MFFHRALAFLLVLSMAPGFVAAAHAGDRIVVTGSSTIAPLMAEIGKRYEKLHPGLRIDVQSGGSTRGVTDVRAGLSDIGMVSRAMTAGESDLLAYEIARDDIYTGRATDWADVGGKPGKITVVNKAEGRSTLELFLAHFGLGVRDIVAHVVIGDNQQGIKTVSANPGAIGYVSIGTAEFEASLGTPVKLLGLEGVPASVANVKNGTYPLSRPLNLVVRPADRERLEPVTSFARSADVDDIVADQFFVPSHP
jgi:phosphate transport system substrate-binding protein